MRPLPQSIQDFIATARVCRIATVRANGEPHVIPVCPVYDGDTTLYVDLGPKSTTAAALQHEQRITVLIDEYHDDWARLRKVILRCNARPVDGVEQDRAWALIREKFPQYVTGWHPRLTMALEIYEWLQEGVDG